MNCGREYDLLQVHCDDCGDTENELEVPYRIEVDVDKR